MYLQADPIGQAGGLNLYGYAEGLPTLNIDPDGLYSFHYERDPWAKCHEPLRQLKLDIHYEDKSSEREIKEWCDPGFKLCVASCNSQPSECSKENDYRNVKCVERCQYRYIQCLREATRVPGNPCWEERLRKRHNVPPLPRAG